MECIQTESGTRIPVKQTDIVTQSEYRSMENVSELDRIGHRIHTLEQYMGNLYDKIVEFTHAKAHLREVEDELAKSCDRLKLIDDTESDNQDKQKTFSSINLTMALIADNILSIADKLDAEIVLFDKEIFAIFENFGHICKDMKKVIRNAQEFEKKHASFRAVYVKHLKKDRNFNRNEKQCMKHEVLKQELEKCMMSSEKITKKCAKGLLKIEQKRLVDVKEILSKWYIIQIAGASKTLELATKGYQTTESIDTDGDFEIIAHDFYQKLNISRVLSNSPDGNENENEQVEDGGGDGVRKRTTTSSRHKTM